MIFLQTCKTFETSHHARRIRYPYLEVIQKKPIMTFLVIRKSLFLVYEFVLQCLARATVFETVPKIVSE